MRQAAIGSVVGLGLLAATCGGALAQGAAPIMPGQAGFQPIVKPDDMHKPPEPKAPALPGAQPGLGAAPADKSTADLAPNAALFDAINRGDIAEARDAVNRGADINAENVLGMKPLELSIDLSRNDITFFLLSLRGAPTGALSAKTVAIASSKPAAPPAPSAKARLTKTAAKPAAPRPAAATAQQYAGAADPGRPDPQAGFLGFGPSLR